MNTPSLTTAPASKRRAVLPRALLPAGLALLGVAVALAEMPAPRSQPQDRDPHAGPMNPWPTPVPVRLKPDGRDELLVTTLGPVSTPLADGRFDPVADRVTTNDGRVIEDYYTQHLEVPYFAPIDKSRFPVPPSGWCSWYYYYQEINADEILYNAGWIAEHLAPYGARYVQIDDGWQGTGHGLGENRDWTTIDERFRDPGMAAIADSIRALGLEAGLWLAPHGQSNENVARASNAFLWKPDGTSASSTWEGTYLVDPSLPAAHIYLRELFTRLRNWGYTYFKIDGQPIVLREYATTQTYMQGTVPDGPADAAAAELYRGTLRTIRDAIGAGSYLLGCWGIPLPGVGILNGSRTGGDIVQGWDGFLVAAEAVQRWNFLHNIAWYSDPDVILVRPPLSDGTARAWATIQGLSGQALMASDRMPDLPESRVAMLRRIYPATDIRPLDLYRPDNVRKPIWDLKVDHLGRTYDVVAVFNYDTERADSRRVAWERLGLDPARAYHVFDFWQGAYLGAWRHGVFLNVPPADVRVVTLVPAEARPVLLSTSRHITQGWVDLLELRVETDAERPRLAGRSRIVGGDPYTLTVGLPQSGRSYRLVAVSAAGDDPAHPVEVTWRSHQGYATATLESAADQSVEWELRFAPSPVYVFPVVSPSRIRATQQGLADVWLSWPTQYHVKAGYLVELDGAPLGVAFQPRAKLRGLDPTRTHVLGVRSVWYDGRVGEEAASAGYSARVPDVLFLSELEPALARQDWGELRGDRSVEGNTLTVGGATYERGLGTHSESDLRYELYGAFRRFRGLVGIDDEVRPPEPVEAIFQIEGDGRTLWTSGPVRSREPPLPVSVDITGVRELRLRVLPGADGIDYDHADWLEARVTRAGE